jgi:hypothetical protein
LSIDEAIKTIETARAEVEWEYPIEYAAAFDVAIRALEKQKGLKEIVSSPDYHSLQYATETLDKIAEVVKG